MATSNRILFMMYPARRKLVSFLKSCYGFPSTIYYVTTRLRHFNEPVPIS